VFYYAALSLLSTSQKHTGMKIEGKAMSAAKGIFIHAGRCREAGNFDFCNLYRIVLICARGLMQRNHCACCPSKVIVSTDCCLMAICHECISTESGRMKEGPANHITTFQQQLCNTRYCTPAWHLFLWYDCVYM
jgi:hypothetical protein